MRSHTVKRIKILIFAAVVFGIAFGSFLKGKYVTPIIMYHSVNPQQNPFIKRLIVHPRSFERQMWFLKWFRYRVVPLNELAQMLRNGNALPWRTVAVTFDDGYKDNYTYAFPILKKYTIPATIFVIINEIGRDDRLSWDEIREMLHSGLVTFGSHTLGPEPLVKVKSDKQVRREIFESKKILEDKLGEPVTVFSYPEGMFNNSIKQLVKDAGYSCAVATSPGTSFSNLDAFALKRIRISSSSDSLVVFWFETTGFYTFLKEGKKK